MGKKAKKVENNYVNGDRIMLYFFPKNILWKKLWKMWKSQLYQQKNGKWWGKANRKKPIFLRKKGLWKLQKLRVTETKIVKKFQSFFAEKVSFFKNDEG